MWLSAVRNLFGRPPPPTAPTSARGRTATSAPSPGPPEDDDPVWPSARIAVAESLWGPGFLFPGGEEETIRWATPIGLSNESSLLLVGAGSGGPPRVVSAAFDVWVGGYEANPRLVAVANARGARGRARIEAWDPLAPAFPPHAYHHGLALEPLGGSKPEPTLPAIAAALKPGGHFVLVETVADLPLEPADPQIATWARLARRAAAAPSELAITGALQRLRFDVRIVEDITQRHVHYALNGWLAAVQAMEAVPPSLRQAALMVREAELWLLRVRLMRAGRLRLVRWHAIGG